MAKIIAIIHNAYGKLSGEEMVIENLAALLAERGVSVWRFSRSSAEIEDKLSGKMAAFFSGIYNPFAAKAFGEFLKSNQPDVVHIHNLYPLISPSILPVCKAFGVPVVMTVHNFRLACPNGLLLSHGEICHRCLGGREYWCVLRNCENSIFKSTGYALRTAAARILRRYYDNVDHFICLSEFQKNIMVGEGLPAHRVSVLANPVSFVKVQKTRDCHSREGGNPGNEMDLPRGHHGPISPFGDDKGMDSRQENSGMTTGGSPTGAFGDDREVALGVHPPSIPPVKGGKYADDRGMDPRQENSGMTESRKISPSGRNDMKISFDTGSPTGTFGDDKGGAFGDDIVAGMSVHPPSIPPVKGGIEDDKGTDSRQENSGMTNNWIPASAGMTKEGFEQGGGYVAYVGRISPEKDIITLLEAARRLGDIPFKFAGDYHRMPEVLKNKPVNVEFLGQLGAEEISEFYRNAKMVVFATRCYEGFPTVLLEAMSHGLPIVCSRIGGLPEIVEEGANGLLYEPGNVIELTARIQTLWQDATLCKKMGEAGRRKVHVKYDAERLLDQLLEIYEKVLAAK